MLPYFFGTNWATRGFYNWGLNSEAAEASGDNGPPIIDRLLEIPLYESIGKISGDIICPYPPGIPLIVPGEIIDKDRIDWIRTQSLYNEYLVNSYIRVLNT